LIHKLYIESSYFIAEGAVLNLAKSEYSSHSNRLFAYVKCDCGKRILVIPNLELMGKAIEAHAQEHAKAKSQIDDQTKEANRVESLLIQQVFNKILK
jgi:hypothetical protein